MGYAKCCAPFHAGEEPVEPSRLVRARYSAYVRREAGFLWRTLHPDHDDREGAYDDFVERVNRTDAVEYRSLDVLDDDGPDDEGVARVLFRVGARMDGKDASFVELSYFVHDGVGWRYLVGELGTPPKDWKKLTLVEFRKRSSR